MTEYAMMVAQYLPAEYRPTYVYECRRQGKDPLLALLLTMFGGLLGAGDFYLGRYLRGSLMLLGTASGIGAIVTVPVWIYRCFTTWRECEVENDYLAYQIGYYYLAMSAQTHGVTGPQPPPPPQAPRRPIGGLPATVSPAR